MPSQTYTTPGSTTWNAQATSAVVEVWGGGGGGGDIDFGDGCGGGGGGGYAKATVTGLTIGVNYTVVVGSGGGLNVAGGQSYFNTATTVRAAGGNAGSNVGGAGGTGGAGTHGTTLYTGGTGGTGAPGDIAGGGGGSSAGTASNGNNGSPGVGYSTGGAGGTAVTGGGAGGHGAYTATAGAQPGGGGGGSDGDSGGGTGSAGGDGKVVITWDTPVGSPSQSPSASPSVSPSASPSVSPSASSSVSPSASASDSPSASPSISVPPVKVYAAPETAITFKDSGGTVTMTLQNLATTASRISARYDRGAGSLPRRYYWKFVFQTEGTPAIGAAGSIWIVESDGTYSDGNYGTADAAVTVIPRCRLLEWNWVTSASASYNFVRSGITTINERYFSIIVRNDTAVNFKNTANVSYVVFTPVPEEVQ